MGTAPRHGGLGLAGLGNGPAGRAPDRKPPSRTTTESFARVRECLKGKFYPALLAWMLDWRRFQWAARTGMLANEPSSWDERLATSLTRRRSISILRKRPSGKSSSPGLKRVWPALEPSPSPGGPEIRWRGRSGGVDCASSTSCMDFIDLKSQQQRIRPILDRRIAAVLDHGQYILGPEVKELEERLSGFLACRHALGVSSVPIRCLSR